MKLIAEIHSGSVQHEFREPAKAFVRTDRQRSVSQMQSLQGSLRPVMPGILTDAPATDSFNARAFKDIMAPHRVSVESLKQGILVLWRLFRPSLSSSRKPERVESHFVRVRMKELFFRFDVHQHFGHPINLGKHTIFNDM